MWQCQHEHPCLSTTSRIKLSSFFSTPGPQLLILLHRHSCSANERRRLCLVLGGRYGLPTGQRTARAACLILSTSTSSIFPGLRDGKHMKCFHVWGTSRVSICTPKSHLLRYHPFGNLYPALTTHIASHSNA